MSLSPSQTEALRALGHFFLSQGQHAKAVTLFATLDRLQPDTPGHLRALATACDRNAQPAQALQALDRLAMSGNLDVFFHTLRAKVLADLNRWDEAREAMQSAIRLRRSGADAASPSGAKPASRWTTAAGGSARAGL